MIFPLIRLPVPPFQGFFLIGALPRVSPWALLSRKLQGAFYLFFTPWALLFRLKFYSCPILPKSNTLQITNAELKNLLNCGPFMTKENPAFIHIALFEPEIHPNVGNIARLCAANAFPLHLVGNLGFRIDDRSIRRAGLDYWPFVNLHREKDLEELRARIPESRLFYFSTRAGRVYTDVEYRAGDCLVFGPESRGLPEELLQKSRNHALKIPMISSNVRSLNLATAVGIAAYEALRQIVTLYPEGTPWK